MRLCKLLTSVLSCVFLAVFLNHFSGILSVLINTSESCWLDLKLISSLLIIFFASISRLIISSLSSDEKSLRI